MTLLLLFQPAATILPAYEATHEPIPRVAVDWDDDLFICYDCLTSDALNVMHSGVNADAGAVNLHWVGVDNAPLFGASASFVQSVTDYGIRLLRVVTGTHIAGGSMFGSDGVSNNFQLTNGATYTAVFWVRSTNATAVGFNFVMVGIAGSVPFTTSATWQKITKTFTAGSSPTAFQIAKGGSATNVTMEMTGFMIVAGSSAPSGFNVGHPTNPYDVIRPESITIKCGKQKWDDAFPAEGTVDITLDNSSRRYSPEYSGSPLYGYNIQRLLITIDFLRADGAAWVRKFAGWVRNIEPEYGKTKTKKVTLSADQGVFRMKEMRYAPVVAGETTADVLIADVIERGYVTPATALQAPLNRARLNASYLVAQSDLMTLDSGVSDILPTGEEWGVDESSDKVLRDVMEVEHGHFFIQRDGRVLFQNRQHHTDPAAKPLTQTVNLDTDAIDGKYAYGKAYRNRVRVHYKPASTRVGTIWTSRGSLLIAGQNGKRRHQRVIDVKFEYEEGKKLTVQSVNDFNDGSADQSTYSALSPVGNVDLTDYVSVRFEALQNGGGRLFIKNTGRQNAYVTIIMKGTIVETFGGQQVDVVDTSNLKAGVYLLESRPSLLNTADDAENLANHLLAMHKDAFGQYEDITIMNNSAVNLQRILDLEQGNLISISEYQTGHSGTYVIIGEDHRWQPGLLRSRFRLHPQFRTDKYWILGVSTLGVDTYLGY